MLTDPQAILDYQQATLDRDLTSVPSWLDKPADNAPAAEHAEYDKDLADHRGSTLDYHRKVAVSAYTDGLALRAGESAWVQAIPEPDTQTWLMRGRLGSIGDEDGRILLEETLTGPDPMLTYFREAAPAREPEDPAFDVISGLRNFARRVQTQAENITLLDSIPGLVITEAGGAVPFQAGGTLHGLPFYFRFRSGTVSLIVWDPDEDTDGMISNNPLYSSHTSYGDSYAGSLDQHEFTHLMRLLVSRLEKAAVLWEFTGIRTVAEPTLRNGEGEIGAPTSMKAWGHTPEEAWERITTTGSGISAEDWAAYIDQQGLDPHTVTVDERVFPDPEPQFTVLPLPDGYPPLPETPSDFTDD